MIYQKVPNLNKLITEWKMPLLIVLIFHMINRIHNEMYMIGCKKKTEHKRKNCWLLRKLLIFVFQDWVIYLKKCSFSIYLFMHHLYDAVFLKLSHMCVSLGPIVLFFYMHCPWVIIIRLVVFKGNSYWTISC